ncbi:MAG TPA: hypothetical protein VHF26_13375, partial [Trebonia sp.]|nr:hypothetical protein [Trebonia sp.]
YLDRFLMFYVRTADRLQRTAPWLEAMEGGIEHLRAVVVDDCLGIADELEADMRRHVETYVDEWREVLADPRKLARFRTFVNAPGVADPNIVTVEERSQRRPAGDDRRPGREVLVAGPALPVGAPGGAG